MHQVRHPLRVINTLVNRCRRWDKYWFFISTVYGMGGLSTSQTPLRRAMLLYVLWNRHIERYADLRFRGETTSPRDVCTWARFRDELCRSNGEFSAANSTIVEPEVAEEVEEAQVVIGEEEGSGEEEKEEGEVLVGDGERDAEAEVYLAWEEERRQAAQKKKASRGLRTHRPHPTRSPSSSRAHNTKGAEALTRRLTLRFPLRLLQHSL